ncbi:MAG TPA: aminodeoxychorismate synthase component I [Galbitalea sp.]|jgi:anthranilate synthase component 1|nr:aminodeoxychorismate synthase component I [Galbitalea sp.]
MPGLQRFPFRGWIDPADAFVALYGNDTDVVWLDSGPTAKTGRSYVGRAARVVTSEAESSMLQFLRRELRANRIESAGDGFALGWVGWVGYETRFETMGTPRTRVSPYPDSAFVYLDRAIEFDHASHTVTLLSLDRDAAWQAETTRSLSSSRGRARANSPLRQAREPHGLEGSRPATWRNTDDAYLAMIRECKARIAAGDAYQLCLTTEARVDAHPDPVETYRALREANPTHHGALLRVGDIALLSSSPEQFLAVSPTGAIESRPIKGTRPRGADPETDAALAHELSSSDKERAENLMIVDLMRNDIGRVSRIGSVQVPSLLQVEPYATVHQLVSTVRGQLEEGLDGIDAVVACFPAGSMTGTPKSSATTILDRLEDAPRGIYSGAFGYFGLDGRIDLAMVIRSIVLSPGGASIGSGGGITALSDPVEELAEVKLKAAALLDVLGVRTS